MILKPFWLDRFPRTRRPSYPRFKGEAETDVVIVGGGLTGCACASVFAAAGVGVVLLESDAIGAGATAGSMGLVREELLTRFEKIEVLSEPELVQSNFVRGYEKMMVQLTPVAEPPAAKRPATRDKVKA